jgi:hypothetical protein
LRTQTLERSGQIAVGGDFHIPLFMARLLAEVREHHVVRSLMRRFRRHPPRCRSTAARCWGFHAAADGAGRMIVVGGRTESVQFVVDPNGHSRRAGKSQRPHVDPACGEQVAHLGGLQILSGARRRRRHQRHGRQLLGQPLVGAHHLGHVAQQYDRSAQGGALPQDNLRAARRSGDDREAQQQEVETNVHSVLKLGGLLKTVG